MSRLSEKQPQRTSLARFKKDSHVTKSQTSDLLKSPRQGSQRSSPDDAKLARNRSYVKSQNLADRMRGLDDGGRPFAQSREEMIDRYLELAMEYRDLLLEHKYLETKRKDIEVKIASIFMQDDRLDELIRIVKERNEQEAAQATPKPASRRQSVK